MRNTYPLISALLTLALPFVGCGAATGPDDEVYAVEDAEAQLAEHEAYSIVRQAAPAFQEFVLVNLNTQALNTQIGQGNPITVPFASTAHPDVANPVQVAVTPHSLYKEGAQGKALQSGPGGLTKTTVSLPASTEFAGGVVGAGGSIAGVVSRPNMFMAQVFLPVNGAAPSGWSYVEPVGRVLKANGATPAQIAAVAGAFSHIVYNPVGLVLPALNWDVEAEPWDGEDPAEDEPVLDPPAAGVVNEVIDIYMISDRDHYLEKGSSTAAVFDEQRWILFGVELYWALAEPGPCGNGEFQLEIEIAGQSVWTLGGPTSTGPNDLMEETYFDSDWEADVPDENAVGLTHGFTGKNINGSTIGAAWGIGGFDDRCDGPVGDGTPCKHSISQPNDWSSASWYTQTILMAHELGHVANAVHSQANPAYNACGNVGETIMSTPLTTNAINFYSATNAADIADKVSAECASDPC